MHLLKFYVLQCDQTLKKYLPTIEVKYVTIPQHIRNLMGDTTNCNVDKVDFESPSLPKKVPQTKLSSRTTDDNEAEVMSDFEDITDEEYEENYLEDFDISNDKMIQDVPDSDDVELEDTSGVTLTGCILLIWKLICPQLMSDTCCHILSPHIVVQKHVFAHMSAEDKSAAERMIFKHCIPKHVVGDERENMKATLSAKFWQEHGEYVSVFICISLCSSKIIIFLFLFL